MDHIIGLNHGSKNKDAMPFIVDDIGNRKIFPYNQPVRITRQEAGRLISHFGQCCTVMEMQDWVNRSGSKKKLMVTRSQGIGDIILLTPILRRLAKQYDEVHIGVRQDLQATVANLPYITKVWEHDIHGKGNIPKDDATFLSRIDANMWAEEHDPQRATYHRTISFSKCCQVELQQDEMEPDLYLSKAQVERGRALLRRKEGKRYCAVQPCGSHSYRNLWLEHNTCPHGAEVGTCQICNSKGLSPFPHTIEMIQGLIDSGWTPVILCHYRKLERLPEGCIDFQGRTSVAESFGILNQCDVCVGPDSGLLHAALALGVPTVGMFGICSGKYRFPTYPTEYRILERMPCVGCGDYAMTRCHMPNGIDGECMQFTTEEIVSAVDSLPKRTIKAKIAPEKKVPPPMVPVSLPPAPAVIVPGSSGSNGHGVWMTMMFQDETKDHMERFAERVISHPAISHVIAVDGGCKTGAEKVLGKIGKVEVHLIPYCNKFWNAQAHQRNACFSFVKDHQPVLFMDPDEAFSEGLSAWLKEFPHLGIEYGLVARATWDREEEAKAQNYRSPGTHNWPDWQPRFYRWRQHYKFHGAAHHITLGCPEPILIPDTNYVLHYEEEHGKRADREAQWARMMAQKDVVLA